MYEALDSSPALQGERNRESMSLNSACKLVHRKPLWEEGRIPIVPSQQSEELKPLEAEQQASPATTGYFRNHVSKTRCGTGISTLFFCRLNLFDQL